ncbi:MAG: ABC transporter substrate-binding protein [Polyangiales bacterium]
MHDPFQRIVCLTEEPTEILYLLGEERRIVGISAYTERPAQAKRDKPVVSAFVGGSLSKIQALEPDLVIGFSDVQARFAGELIAAGLQVLIFNQRSVADILNVLVAVGRLVGAEARARALVASYEARITAARARAAQRAERPRVYFEEWDEPSVCGIRWVSELIEIAGGVDVFRERSLAPMAKGRVVRPDEILASAPDVVLASWCGKPFDRAAFLARPGFDALPAVIHDRIHALDPTIILQPGPACLTAGLDLLAQLLAEGACSGAAHVDEALMES